MREARAPSAGHPHASPTCARTRSCARLQQRVHGPRRRLAALRARYGLPQRDVRGLDHDLAYRGARRAARSTSPTSTPPTRRSPHYGLRVLEDDRALLPRVRRGAPLPRRPGDRAPAGGRRRSRRLEGAHRRARRCAAQRRARSSSACPRRRSRPTSSRAARRRRRRAARAARVRALVAAHARAPGPGRRCRCWRRSLLARAAGRAGRAPAAAGAGGARRWPACCRRSRRWRCWCS